MDISERQYRDVKRLLARCLPLNWITTQFSSPSSAQPAMKLILSTSNIMGGGPPVIRRNIVEKSNAELTTSLRANIAAHEQVAATTNGTTTATPSFKNWTASPDPSTLYIPTVDFTKSGLAEERSAYDITVKLFYLPNVPTTQRCAQTREAVDLVLKELHVPSIDLLIVSFPGIAFDADDEDSDFEAVGSDADTTATGIPLGGSGSEPGLGVESIDSMLETWRCLEELHASGLIAKLGLSEFGTQRLARILDATKVRPSVDQINVRDCCVVPKPLILYAKQEGIELLTHNDCTNVLPPGTLRELLGPGEKGAGVLAGEGREDGLKGDVEPQWVVKYTAVVKDRGVVENKGYFAMAELRN